jgi:hypothetical protein
MKDVIILNVQIKVATNATKRAGGGDDAVRFKHVVLHIPINYS